MQALIEELGSFCVLWSWQLSVTLTGLFLRPSLNVVGKHSRISPENKIHKKLVFQLFLLGSSPLMLESFEFFLYPAEIWEFLLTTFKLGLRKNLAKVIDNCELQWTQNNPNSLIILKELGSFCVLWSWQLSVTLTGLFFGPVKKWWENIPGFLR